MNVGHSTVPLSDDRRVSASFHIFTVNLSHRRTAQWPQPSKRDAFRPGFQPLGPLTDYHRPIRSPSCYLPTSSDRGKLSFLLGDGPSPDIFFFLFWIFTLVGKTRWWKSFKARIVRRSREIWRRAPCVQRSKSATLSPSDYDSFDMARPPSAPRGGGSPSAALIAISLSSLPPSLRILHNG